MIVAVARARKDAKTLSHALNCETLSLGGIRDFKDINYQIFEKLKNKIVLFFAGKNDEKIAEKFLEEALKVTPFVRVINLSKKAVRNTRLEEIREKFELEKAKLRLSFEFNDVFMFSNVNGLGITIHPDYDAYFILSEEFAENMENFFGIKFAEGNLIVRKLMNEEWIYSPKLKAIISKKIGEKCRVLAEYDSEVLKIEIKKMVERNEYFLKCIEKISAHFLKEIANSLDAKRIAVPFSGGKDSLASLILSKKVFDDVTAVFIKTNFDPPFTEEYVECVCDKLDVELKIANVEFDISSGYPTLEDRWCTKLKMKALEEVVNEINADMLVVGDREAESRTRRLRPEVMNRIGVEVYPIKYWSGAMVQLYCIMEGLSLHPLYYSGFYRIGCLICPSMSEWEHKILRKVIYTSKNKLVRC